LIFLTEEFVNERRNIRSAAMVCLVLLCGMMAHAQRGGGPGGGGGMMGGPRGGGMGFMHPLPQQRIHVEPMITLPGRWWDDKRTIKQLNLRTEQQQRMDTIFESNKGTLISLYGNLQHEQQRFVQMPREDLQDETKVFAQIDRIAQARADLEKANFHTLMQIRKELDPDQAASMEKIIADSSQ
jgi:Spy/CpxP family protein refolding chaperone